MADFNKLAKIKAKGPAFAGKPKKDEDFSFDVPTDEESGIMPEGPKYIGKCVGVKKAMSQKNNNPMFEWDFVVTKGEYSGRDFKLYTAITQAAMWKLTETMAAFGITGEPGEQVRFTKGDVIGVLVVLDVFTDEYRGQKQSKLQGIQPHPKGAGYRSGQPVKAQVEEEEPEEVEEEIEQDDEDIELDEAEASDEDEVEEAEEDSSDEDSDEEPEESDEDEEEPVPVKKKAVPVPPVKGGKAPATLQKRKVK